LGEDFGMEPETKRHTMSHPPDRVSDVENNIGKDGKSNKNDKRKVLVNFKNHYKNKILDKF